MDAGHRRRAEGGDPRVAPQLRAAREHAASGNWKRAAGVLEHAQRIAPGDLEVLGELAAAYKQLDDLDGAKRCFRSMLLQRLDESTPISRADVLFELGSIDAQQGARAKAINMLERALENDPGHGAARALLDMLMAGSP